MPVHDWTRVEDGIFHHFHNAWNNELSNALNGGLLPPDYYAWSSSIPFSGPLTLTLMVEDLRDLLR